MEAIVVRRGEPLRGEISVRGAKNSVLKLMAATTLAEGRSVLRNVPKISDVLWMGELLGSMGSRVTLDRGELTIETPGDLLPEAPYELVERMRASIVVLGPLLARFGTARVALPGGDDFGPRPIDMHLQALEDMGASFTFEHGYIQGTCDRLRGTAITLEYPSVGATENALMAAVLADGRTVIENAAREPEIADLAAFLSRMGAQILGAGSPRLEIEGVESLSPVDHEVVPDRIEAATFAAAVGVAGGEVTLRGARAEHMTMFVQKIGEMGMRVSPEADGLWVMAPERLTSVDISTLPYPGLATDYKPFFVAMLSLADGVGFVTENIFAGRFRYFDELRRMGADIRAVGNHAIVRGKERLSGAPVRAGDIRAGAAMVIAGLGADGDTIVADAHHIARGYEDFVGRLASIGADIELKPS